jgi:hypothetical protein
MAYRAHTLPKHLVAQYLLEGRVGPPINVSTGPTNVQPLFVDDQQTLSEVLYGTVEDILQPQKSPPDLTAFRRAVLQ